jgi:hypothetical protein
VADVSVRTELKLDDLATEVLNRIRSGFDDVDAEVDQTQSSLRDFGTQFAATFAAVSVGPLLGKLKDVVTGFIDVGSEAYDLEQNIAGMLAGMTGNEWVIARAYAEDLNAQFNTLTISSGVLKDDIKAGHQELVTFLGGGSRAFQVASDNLQNLTTLADVQGLSMQRLGMDFGRMSAGMVAMESPLFNLLRGTGIFASKIEDVNKEWRELTQEERINRLSGAIGSIAENLGKAPPTLSDMVTSIRAIGDEFMETFGKSAMTEFMGGLVDLQGDLGDARGDLRAFAKDVGREVGQFAGDAIKGMRDAFAFIQTHADEIKSAVKEGFQFARDTVTWILAHKTELMVLGGGMMLSMTGAGGGLLGGLGGAVMGGLGGAANALGERQASRSMGLLGAPSPGAPRGGGMVPLPKLDLTGLTDSQKQVAAINKAVVQDLVNTHGVAGQVLMRGSSQVSNAVQGMSVAQQAIVKAAASTGTVAGRFGSAMSGFVASGGPAVQMGAQLTKGIGSLAGAIIAGGPPAWAATAAVTAFAGGLIYLNAKVNEAEDERNRIVDDGLKEYAQLSQTMGVLNDEQIKRMDELRAAAERAASDKLIPERTFERFEGMDKQRRGMLQGLFHPLEDAFSNVDKIAKKVGSDTAHFDAVVKQFGATSSAAIDEEEKYMQGLLELAQAEEASVGLITQAFAKSWQAHDQSSMEYILGVVNRSEQLRNAFVRSADMSAEGFAKMISVAEQMGPQFQALVTGLKGRQEQEIEEMTKGAAPQVNFNGGQVFKIEQNFRDQEPDRIAIAFEKRFTQAAISRVQATTATPFGT